MDDPAKRDSAGRFGIGNQANPSGRPKLVREYQEWIKECAWEPAKRALLSCLASDDQRVVMIAVKEINDRMLGKAPQAITGEDGASLLGNAADLFGTLQRLAAEKK